MFRTDLTQIQLHSKLIYDVDTGQFHWRKRPWHRAGCRTSEGYRLIFVLGTQYLEHRLAWLYIYGEWPKEQIDHINRDKADNRISNLRDVSQSVNQLNTGMRKDNETGVKGVYIRARYPGYMVAINKKYVGVYTSFGEAKAAAEEAHHATHYRNTQITQNDS